MADRDDARPQFNPKHRIVGAIIVVSFAVIFLPMILDERQPPPELKSTNETSVRDRTQQETRVVIAPVAPVEIKPKDSSDATPKIEAPVTAAVTQPKPEPKPVAQSVAPVKKTASPTPEKIAKPSVAAAEKITKGWILQVGTFSNTENATRLRDNLKSHGHNVHVESVSLAGKKGMRLRVGPFHEKSQAAKVQTQIHNETGVQAALQTYP